MRFLKFLKDCFFDVCLTFEKKYKTFIALGVLVFVIWFSYDLGSVLTEQNMQEKIGGRPTKTINTEEMLDKIKDYQSKRGVLYINFDGVKLKDENGELYNVSDFNDQVNKFTLDAIKEKLDVKGKTKIDIVPQNKGEKELISTIFLDFLTKAIWLAFYSFIFIYIVKYLLKTKSTINSKRYKVFDRQNSIKVKIKDVAGQGEAKKEVVEIVSYLKNPKKYEKVGAKMPKGILLYGPPGTGKTVIAKAIAGEADASFISQSASSFIDTYVGQGASSVRALFSEARKIKPCVIFIDEIDAIAGSRDMGGSEERLQTLNQLLIEMDGFEDNRGIIVIAATNRIETIDKAIVRPGRFDRKVLINLPNEEERVEILNIYIDKAKISNDVDVLEIAKKTISFSGADLENLVNEAAIEAARGNKDKIEMKDFNLARDRILIGTKNSRVPTNSENTILAYHELGHAMISYLKGRYVEKVSIIPRGLSLGVTLTEVKDDILRTEEDLKNDIIMLMAGRAAEEVFCHKITTGSYDDIHKASDLARKMVGLFGFNKDTPYIPMSEGLKIEDEKEAEKIVKNCFEEAKTILKDHEEKMKSLCELLLIQKEINNVQMKKIIEDHE